MNPRTNAPPSRTVLINGKPVTLQPGGYFVNNEAKIPPSINLSTPGVIELPPLKRKAEQMEPAKVAATMDVSIPLHSLLKGLSSHVQLHTPNDTVNFNVPVKASTTADPHSLALLYNTANPNSGKRLIVTSQTTTPEIRWVTRPPPPPKVMIDQETQTDEALFDSPRFTLHPLSVTGLDPIQTTQYNNGWYKPVFNNTLFMDFYPCGFDALGTNVRNFAGFDNSHHLSKSKRCRFIADEKITTPFPFTVACESLSPVLFAAGFRTHPKQIGFQNFVTLYPAYYGEVMSMLASAYRCVSTPGQVKAIVFFILMSLNTPWFGFHKHSATMGFYFYSFDLFAGLFWVATSLKQEPFCSSAKQMQHARNFLQYIGYGWLIRDTDNFPLNIVLKKSGVHIDPSLGVQYPLREEGHHLVKKDEDMGIKEIIRKKSELEKLTADPDHHNSDDSDTQEDG